MTCFVGFVEHPTVARAASDEPVRCVYLYACDACGKLAPGERRVRPDGWALVESPGRVEACSAACRAALEREPREIRPDERKQDEITVAMARLRFKTGGEFGLPAFVRPAGENMELWRCAVCKTTSPTRPPEGFTVARLAFERAHLHPEALTEALA